MIKFVKSKNPWPKTNRYLYLNSPWRQSPTRTAAPAKATAAAAGCFQQQLPQPGRLERGELCGGGRRQNTPPPVWNGARCHAHSRGAPVRDPHQRHGGGRQQQQHNHQSLATSEVQDQADLSRQTRYCCATSSVEDPGCLSRIPDPDFYPSRIPDFGSLIQQRKKNFTTIFCSQKYHKIVRNFIFEQVKKIFLTKTLKNIVLFTQKFVINKLSKIRGLGSGIRDPKSRGKKAPDPA